MESLFFGFVAKEICSLEPHIESLICNTCKPLWAALIKMAFLQDRKLVLVLLQMTGVRQLGFHFWLCHRFPV